MRKLRHFHSVAYANSGLTPLIPSLYAGLDVVSRELVGFLPSVSRDSRADRAALNQSITYHVAPAAHTFTVTPAMTVPEPADQTLGTDSMTISKSIGADIGWNGEEQLGLNSGIGYQNVLVDQIAQGVRALTNLMEVDLAVAAMAAASRATGTAGTTPFAAGLGDSAQLRKILDDNGAPLTGRSLVMNTAAGANVRTLTQLTKVNEAGSTMMLNQGELMNIHGFSLKESGQYGALTHVKGTAAGATTNAAGYAVGATVITLASAGTGTILAGDTVMFAGDANKYQVMSGDADVSNGGTFTLAAPGLRVAIPANATAITIGGTFTGSIGFSRNALVLATRAPALPEGGDSADDRMLIVDPRSGIAFEFSLYRAYRKVRLEVCAAWGVKATKSEHIGLLLG
jgi:P22 coat protein - gene protein 5